MGASVQGWGRGGAGGGRETRFVPSKPKCDKRNEIMKCKLPPDCRYALLKGAYQLHSGGDR